jgi:hypothetical protein
MDNKGNTENGSTKGAKPHLDWSKWDVVFFVIFAPLAILAMLVILAPTGQIDYLSGRFDLSLDWLVFIALIVPGLTLILSLPFLAVGLPLVVAGIMRLASGWRKYTARKRCIRTAQIGIWLFSITALVLPGLLSNKPYSPSHERFTSGFADRIKSKADIEAIRNWLKTLSKERCTGQATDLSFGGYPKSVKVLKPRYVRLGLDGSRNPNVRLTWGGGLSHWGVVIGTWNMQIPPSDFSQFRDYRLPVEPGVYVWYELQ